VRSSRSTDPAIQQATEIITRGFRARRDRASHISGRARRRFEQGDWAGLHADAIERLDVFPQAVAQVLAELEARLGTRRGDRELWRDIRASVHAWLATRHDADLGATFYNSVVRRALHTIGADPETEFVGGLPDLPPPPVAVARPVRDRLELTVRRIFEDIGWSLWQNLPADAAVVTRRIEQAWQESAPPVSVEVLPHVFYRGTRAFIVGRVVGLHTRLPLTVAFRHDDGGIAADAVLLTEDAVSVVFSFTRAYFHVDDTQPSAMVTFLGEIMPRKPRNELYTALGFFKHGKTLLYLDVARHIEESTD
jgi:isocitrate dehydrogenase kinase/phosphatase